MDLSLLPVLAYFLRSESSVSQAAEVVGADLDEVYYRVRKLERLGILEVTVAESRPGRPIKRYGASAQAFWGPLEPGAAWSVFDFLLGPDSPPVYGTNFALSLTHEQAKAMQHELHAFAEAWRTVSLRNRREGSGEPTRTLLFGTGLAPE